MTKDEFNEKYEYNLEEIDHLRKTFMSKRGKKSRVWKLLDAYDSGEFWETLRTKLPGHQIIPDSNYVFYVKDNIVNSAYAAPYIADVLPVDPADLEESQNINKFIEYEYNRQELGYKQLEIGGRAALINVGFLECGWDSSVVYNVGNDKNVGQMTFTKRDAMATLLDPNYEDFQEGRAVFITTEDSYENLVAAYPDSKSEIDALSNTSSSSAEAKRNMVNIISPTSQLEVGKGYLNKGMEPMSEGMIAVFVCYKKVPLTGGGYRIDQIIYTDSFIVLSEIKGIKPNRFPIVALFDSPPEKDGYGTSKCERIMKNALSLNILDSIAVTHTYAAQRAPVVIDVSTGLNATRVAQDINRPDRVFTINGGDARNAIHRMEFPSLPANLESIAMRMEYSIQRITGIDEKYRGRDTASVTTTGGMERLQSRVSMTDNTRITMIEKYARDLTRMILDFHVYHGGVRHFATSKAYNSKQGTALSVDFNKYRSKGKAEMHQFAYHIDASPLLPKNRARLAEAANIIMQIQMQYQGQIELLSPEEWLFFQDFPQKDMILDRMKLDRLKNDFDEIASEVSSFSAMTEEGMRPETAVQQLADERQVKREPGVMRKQLQQQGM